MWIWQQADWPNFIWDEKSLNPSYATFAFTEGMLLGKNVEPT